jgi:Putative Ig domain
MFMKTSVLFIRTTLLMAILALPSLAAGADGATLFATYCTGCHSKSNLSGRTAAQIQTAMTAVSSHGSFRASLAPADYQSLATYLAATTTTTLTISTSALATGAVGTAYSQTLTASGGTSPYVWAVASGTLPTGLTLSSAGVLGGTPTTVATVTITFRVSDASSPVVSATKALSVMVNPAGSASRTNVALATNGGVASASSTISANFPVTAVNNGDRKGAGWGATTGGWNDGTINLYPDWLQITFNGQKSISEIDLFTLQNSYTTPLEPTTGMTFTAYGITAFDAQYWNGTSWVTLPGGSITGNTLVWRTITFPAVTTDRIRIVVNGALGGYSRITELEAYSTGSTTPAAPDGATLFNANCTGCHSSTTLSGRTPTQIQTAMTGISSHGGFTFTTADIQAISTYLGGYTPTAPGQLTVATTSLPVAVRNSVYSQALTATGGTAPYKWSSTGVLPPGLGLYASGILSGTPTSLGSWSFSVRVSDALSASATRALTVTVAATAPLSITTATLAAATMDTPYTAALLASGGKPPYSWKGSGILPPALSVSSAGGISGTPTSGGAYTFTATVTDAAAATVTAPLSLTVTSPPLLFPAVKPAQYGSCTNCHTSTPYTLPPAGQWTPGSGG